MVLLALGLEETMRREKDGEGEKRKTPWVRSQQRMAIRAGTWELSAAQMNYRK